MMKRLLLFILSAYATMAQAQYISRSEPVPFSCPVVCPGSTIVLKVSQVQNLNVGDTLYAWLSDATGSFASGTTTLKSTKYSLNTGTSYTNGAYTFSSNVNDLYFVITIPNNQPVGSNYTIKMKTSAGFVATDLFQCSGTNYITVGAAYTTIAAVPNTTWGIGEWIGHVYTWISTTTSQLTTVALVNAQDFFNPANYQGHLVKDSLSFDIDYQTANGGTCPGTPGTKCDSTSIPCSQGFSSLFSIKMLRLENFVPGLYRVEIQGDDGIRLSVDSGNTWLLSSYFEQLYTASHKTTDSAYPTGICLSGPTRLMVDFFQRNVDARITVKFTRLSAIATITPPSNQTTCAGNNVTFSVTGPNTLTYAWYYSTNGGASFTAVPNSAPFSGVNTTALTITGVPAGYNNYLFQCQVSGVCSTPYVTSNALLTVSSAGGLTTQPKDTTVCAGSTAIFSVAAGSAYQWQQNSGSGFVNINNGGIYAGATTDSLVLTGVTAGMTGYQFQCIVTGCGGITVTSNAATLTVGASASIAAQPSDVSICQGGNTSFSISANGAATYQWQVDTGSGFANISNNNIYSGATTNTLTLTSVPATNNGYHYRCLVTGCGGAGINSNLATIAITNNPSITNNPVNASACPGGNASFTVTAAGSNLIYQWQENTGSGFTNITNGGIYSNATTSTLTLTGVTATQQGYQYQCLVTGCGSATVTSTVATLSISSATTITKQPSDTIICAGNNASINIIASSGTSYQWQVNTGSGFVNVSRAPYSGEATTTLLISGGSISMNGYKYQCLIGTCGGTSLTSNAASLSVSDTATITSQPKDAKVCAAGNITFDFTATGASSIVWQISSDSGNTFASLQDTGRYQGTTTTSLAVSADTDLVNTQYRALITGCSQTKYTTIATIIGCPQVHYLFLPTAISANGDNVNDKFHLLGNITKIKTLSVAIYNRWGEKVFASESPAFAWDGSYKGDTNNGTFVYYLSATFTDGYSITNQKGNVTVLH